ncbi:MBL fold metallo-hydrolase [Legionella quateirensis]|uniref:Zn-dependent hydrolase GumP n=1 Tax=Legionella quateirensis TaxID=45072 RepID=A0A378KU80_9GAMM|nr:MBL fold metallo-hydrolase [Legionella quateirensis]KTD51015.1 Zn-dependent hydrolase GumP [Legionella quateirensis]STY17739.1 Zn-dependent hydrolase GumP [Legionella quateirensis]
MIEYRLFEAGYCRHCERMTLKSGRLKQSEYPALCALIKHPHHGYILFDTGYSDRFFHLTKKFPFSLYRHLTPVVLQKSLKEQLLQHNIQPEEINYIVISHFHADHIGGIIDFPNARYICHPAAIEDIKNKKGIRALLQGFLPKLLPDDFYQRLIVLNDEIPLTPSLLPFTSGFDLFDDGLLIAISLPGHAKGQIGLYFNSLKETFLVADSCWHQETFKELDYPSELTYLIHHDKKEYLQTIKNLHSLSKTNKEIDIIPSHCKKIAVTLKGNSK